MARVAEDLVLTAELLQCRQLGAYVLVIGERALHRLVPVDLHVGDVVAPFLHLLDRHPVVVCRALCFGIRHDRVLSPLIAAVICGSRRLHHEFGRTGLQTIDVLIDVLNGLLRGAVVAAALDALSLVLGEERDLIRRRVRAQMGSTRV